MAVSSSLLILLMSSGHWCWPPTSPTSLSQCWLQALFCQDPSSSPSLTHQGTSPSFLYLLHSLLLSPPATLLSSAPLNTSPTLISLVWNYLPDSRFTRHIYIEHLYLDDTNISNSVNVELLSWPFCFSFSISVSSSSLVLADLLHSLVYVLSIHCSST